jgi:hypothetical protein
MGKFKEIYESMITESPMKKIAILGKHYDNGDDIKALIDKAVDKKATGDLGIIAYTLVEALEKRK